MGLMVALFFLGLMTLFSSLLTGSNWWIGMGAGNWIIMMMFMTSFCWLQYPKDLQIHRCLRCGRELTVEENGGETTGQFCQFCEAPLTTGEQETIVDELQKDSLKSGSPVGSPEGSAQNT